MLKSKAISEEEADSRSKAKSQAEAAIQSARAIGGDGQNQCGLHPHHRADRWPHQPQIITEGNLVNGNQGQATLLTTIVSLDPIYCYFDADERAILKYQQLAREGKGANFRDGQMPCEVELANETGFPHKGVLDFVDNRVDPATGTLRVRGMFPNPGPDYVLQPGYFARVRVPGSAKYQALLIPDQAVGTRPGTKVCLCRE